LCTKLENLDPQKEEGAAKEEEELVKLP